MDDLYTFLLPVAILAVIMLFRFAGCSFSTTVGESYPDIIKGDNPLFYYRLQETGMLPRDAADEMGRKNGTYGISPSPLNDPAYLSPTVLTPGIELGVSPSIVPLMSYSKAVRFNGSDVFAIGPIGPLPKFSVEAIVRPEWNLINNRGFFFCVFESSAHVPGLGAPTPLKNTGFAVFAGPHDLASPAASPYCWQLWVGTGTEFHRASPLESGPVPLVKSESTYLAVTFDDPEVVLYAYTPGEDLDFISHALTRPPYVQAIHPLDGISLRIGLAGGSAALVPPFPGPAGGLYPFVGRMAEVALYERALTPAEVRSHITAAFNT